MPAHGPASSNVQAFSGTGLPALILGAGFSRRMGACKLTLPWRGEALIGHVVRAGREAGLGPLLLITRPNADPHLRRLMEEEAGQPDTEVVIAPRAADGQAESLKAGIRRLLQMEAQGAAVAGAAILLGDQPLIRPALIRRLASVFFRNPERAVAPVYGGRRGHPVILPRRAFAAALDLAGDAGARSLLHAHDLELVAAEDDSILVDIDTRDAYEYLLSMKDRPS